MYVQHYSVSTDNVSSQFRYHNMRLKCIIETLCLFSSPLCCLHVPCMFGYVTVIILKIINVLLNSVWAKDKRRLQCGGVLTTRRLLSHY